MLNVSKEDFNSNKSEIEWVITIDNWIISNDWDTLKFKIYSTENNEKNKIEELKDIIKKEEPYKDKDTIEFEVNILQASNYFNLINTLFQKWLFWNNKNIKELLLSWLEENNTILKDFKVDINIEE